MRNFSSLQEFHTYMEWSKPEHPMFSIISLDTKEMSHRKNSPSIKTDMYMIVFKRVISGNFNYGRTNLDFSNGAMIFISPRQSFQWQEVELEQQGFMINIHEDYLRGTRLADRIKIYGYFSYSVNEALHLSPKEEAVITSIGESIEAEYLNNQDEHSKEIIISLLDTLLKYAERFYKRQFINRQEMNGDLYFRVQKALSSYFETGKFEEFGAPSISWLADELLVSSRYLSDALKAETGKTAKEHIHLFLIDEAKNLLLDPGKTTAEVAYQLGFNYPQYFSRLFKKKVGLSPKEYRKSFDLH